MIGKLLGGRYKVKAPLGEGGVGETFLAVDTQRPGEPQCVVKRLKPERSPNQSSGSNHLENVQRLFASEAQTLEKLGKHDQIPQLLAYFYSETEKEFYLVQEFIDGHALSVELPPGKPWAEKKVISLLQDVLGILEFVHSERVIHRDVKPTNLIRRYHDRKLVLIDFGAVKIKIAPQLNTHTHGSGTISIGTEGYMPPEQAMGQPSFRSDLYALGMISIQALMGIPTSELKRDEDGEVIWYPQGRASDQLAARLSKLVRFRSSDRYRSATEAIAALAPLVDSFSSPVPTSSAAPASLDQSRSSKSQETKVVLKPQPVPEPEVTAPKETQIASISESSVALPAREPIVPVPPSQPVAQETRVAAKPEQMTEPIASPPEAPSPRDRQTKVVQDAIEQPISSTVAAHKADLESLPLKPQLSETRMAARGSGHPPKLSETKFAANDSWRSSQQMSNPPLSETRIADDAIVPPGEASPRYPGNRGMAGVAIGVGVLGVAGVIIFFNWFTHTESRELDTVQRMPEPTPSIAPPRLKGDYRQLQQYLSEHNWEAADQETYEVMLKVAGSASEKEGVFDPNEWEKFPCEDLQRIDTLWQQASSGKLGFSAQVEVLDRVGDAEKYYETVGWKTPKGEWNIHFKRERNNRFEYENNKKKPDFEAPIISGHLPVKPILPDGKIVERLRKMKSCRL